jgi:hypothetical protein
MQFNVGSVVKDVMSGNHGIILECLPYEYDEDDLDSDMENEYKVFMIGRDEIIYFKEIFITKES